ncbi:MAG: 4Fe-4S dicluster domain-containing protein [Candidatus Omnitrophota bacterium]|jgi:Na+-translocating ferredoxin:NAD+ oxidoreductase RNF subunit RnfB|nr:MAG: 4Fe-4S dicluster domain-containing protein [Candidatus Omnitrophota bacterium]
MDILVPVITLGLMGLLFGVGLALAAKKFCVANDPRLEAIYGKLPQANCGACGMPGCMGFAEGLIEGRCTLAHCSVSTEDALKAIAGILGIELKTKIKAAAVLHCYGGSVRAKDKGTYRGVRDCVNANLIMQGQKLCAYGCIGFGTCAQVCPFNAIVMNEEDLPVVNEDKCTACGKCVAVCPKKLFSLIPKKHKVYVACSSHDSGKDTKTTCSTGCIACRLCEKACPFDAIHVIDNLAIIDYNKCTSCKKCVAVCPVKIIKTRE